MYALALLQDGTSGMAYLLKDRLGDVAELLLALHEVTHDGSVTDPLVVEELVARRCRITHSPLAVLTPRELDVFALA
jgi:hypothetical protein